MAARRMLGACSPASGQLDWKITCALATTAARINNLKEQETLFVNRNAAGTDEWPAGAEGGSATLVHVPERATIKLQPQDGGEGCRSQTSVNQGAGRGSDRSLAWGSRSQGRAPPKFLDRTLQQRSQPLADELAHGGGSWETELLLASWGAGRQGQAMRLGTWSYCRTVRRRWVRARAVV